ncbi:MAG: hypothetical protein ABIL76_08715 [candidate division WOR-3 bacterium]
MKWKVGLGIFALGIMSNAHAVTRFYTEIRASTITNQAIFSLKELPNKKLVFLSRGDQSLSHFAIGFLDTIGQLVDYVTYQNPNGNVFVAYQISVTPDGNNAIISGRAVNIDNAIPWNNWTDPIIISLNLNTKSINWAKNMGPGCLDGYGHAVEVIDNSTAIISFYHACGNQRAEVLEKVQLNSYNVLYRKNVLINNSVSIGGLAKIVKRPGSLGLGAITGRGSDMVYYITAPITTIALNSGNVIWYKNPFGKIDSSMITSTSFRNSYDYSNAYAMDMFTQAFLLSTSDSGLLVGGILCEFRLYGPYQSINLCNPNYDFVEVTQVDTIYKNVPFIKMALIKFDKDGNVKWIKLYSLSNFSVQPNGLAEVSDGYIIGAVVGYYEFAQYRNYYDPAAEGVVGEKVFYRFYHPALIKIDKNSGNVIWAYKYIPFNNPNNATFYNWTPSFDNIVITQDSGIVVYGMRGVHPYNYNVSQIPLPPHGGIRQYPFKWNDISLTEQYGWVLKTDKNGNTCPSVQRQQLNLIVQNYNNYTTISNNVFSTQDYNFSPDNYNPTQTTGLYYTNNNCYITPVSNNESNNCSSKEFKLLNNKIVFDQEREFRIYDLSGKLVYGGRAKEYVINRKGIYILKINNITYKILIK